MPGRNSSRYIQRRAHKTDAQDATRLAVNDYVYPPDDLGLQNGDPAAARAFKGKIPPGLLHHVTKDNHGDASDHHEL